MPNETNNTDTTTKQSSIIDIASQIKDTVIGLMNAVTEGERITIRDTIDKVIAKIGCTASIANGLVPLYMHEHAEAGAGTITAGRGGGFWKGGKKHRVDKRNRCELCNQVLRNQAKHPIPPKE